MSTLHRHAYISEIRFYPCPELAIMVLLQVSWKRGFEDSRGQGFKHLFSNDFIIAVYTTFAKLSDLCNF